jgi:hypothetical protein
MLELVHHVIPQLSVMHLELKNLNFLYSIAFKNSFFFTFFFDEVIKSKEQWRHVCVSTRIIPVQKCLGEFTLRFFFFFFEGAGGGMKQKVARIYSLPTVQPGDIQNVDRYLISGTRIKKTWN